MTEQTLDAWHLVERLGLTYICKCKDTLHGRKVDFGSPKVLRGAVADHAAAHKLELAVAALRSVLDHLDELADAWQRGVLSESDKMGGWRANRNAEYAHVLRRTLAKIDGD